MTHGKQFDDFVSSVSSLKSSSIENDVGLVNYDAIWVWIADKAKNKLSGMAVQRCRVGFALNLEDPPEFSCRSPHLLNRSRLKRVWINPRPNMIGANVLCYLCSSLPCLVALYVWRLPACLDLVWKWISPIHHHCAWSAVTGVVPFVKLKWDHGNIPLSLCSCQYGSYRYDGYLCQKEDLISQTQHGNKL